MYTPHTSCRACGLGSELVPDGIKHSIIREQLVPVFDLGIQPLANDFCSPNEERAGCAPLKVMMCPRCGLAQLSIVVKPEVLYSKYLYVTSRSATMKAHFESLYQVLKSVRGNFKSLLEIGSNDGTLLEFFAGKGVTVAGIDPADNLADTARGKMLPTVTGVFNKETAALACAVKRGGFDVIVARHVFCHIDDWRSFVDALVIPTHRNSLVYIEVPYAGDMLAKCEFDTIYHEHLSYLSIKPLLRLLEGTHFQLYHIERFPIHGGAIGIMLQRNESPFEPTDSCREFVAKEEITPNTWADFGRAARQRITELQLFVNSVVLAGKTIVGFGASAKSTVWINACGWDKRHLKFITDNTPGKHWKISPGTDIPITDEGAILRELPDYAICFAWNFKAEILENNALARSKGVKFVFPIPKLEIVE